jgi:hypothetical protein
MGRMETRVWLRQLPDGNPSWGSCDFIFDPEVDDYDWLVVYDDLPRRSNERFQRREEVLPCPREHTLLVTTEPSSIKTYGRAYTAQFGCVLTSQAEWALPHSDRIWSQPALHWFYGVGRNHALSFDRLQAASPPAKTKDISMVWSGKSMRHTFHNQRFRFMRDIRAALPEMEVFGRGVRDLDDKAEALDDFRYHIAIENFIGPHHFTEKLSDPFLAFTLPFYCGCPNAADYFPEESFIPIDATDFGAALETIQRAIRDKEYERRLPYIVEARRRVLNEYNFFAVVSREIEKRHRPASKPGHPGTVLSRYALRRKHPLIGLRHIYEKGRSRIIHALKGK